VFSPLYVPVSLTGALGYLSCTLENKFFRRVNFNNHFFRKRVNNRNAHAVQTAETLYEFLSNLPPHEERHNNFERGFLFLRMHINRNTASPIFDSYALIFMNCHNDTSLYPRELHLYCYQQLR